MGRLREGGGQWTDYDEWREEEKRQKKSRVGRSVGRSVGLLSKAKGRGESLRAFMEKRGGKLSKGGKKDSQLLLPN